MKILIIIALSLLSLFCHAQQSAANIYEYDAGPNYFNTKTFFYDNGEEVIAFGAQASSEVARQAIEFVQKKTKNPITWLVILHPNIHNFNGMIEYQKIGAKTIASAKTFSGMDDEYQFKTKYFLSGPGKSHFITPENWPPLTKVDSTFENSYDLKLKNGQTIVLKLLSNPGPSASHTIAYVIEEEALFVGDLVQYQTHALMEGLIINDRECPMLGSWIGNLNELNKMFKRDTEITVFGSRGNQTSLPTAVYDQSRYLKLAYPFITNFYFSNRRNWLGGPVSEKFHKELQKNLEQAFPGYTLSYLTRNSLSLCWECEATEKLK
jgi:glyoxylase-like metal-dependent hydrolase (beta-lactamase superfamily II)